MRIDRRHLLAGSASVLTALAMSSCTQSASMGGRGNRSPAPRVPPLIDEIERRTFQFFWEQVNKANGLFPDRWPTPSFASIAAVGFALTAYPIGVERGWITRQQARDITLTTLRFFASAPMGDARTGVTGHRGFFYHFLDMNTGQRYGETELSTVDTALLLMGVLFAGGWFDDASPDEIEIRKLATMLVDQTDWPWAQHANGGISMGWHPEHGFIDRNWDGYNEGMMVYILALGSGRHPVKDGAWGVWTAPYDRFWRGAGAQRHLAFAPLFGHQYSETWIDYRGIYDAPMRAAGFDYFENSRRATYANRAYCVANPQQWDGYSNQVWGLTACDGPGDYALAFNGRTAKFGGYSARGPLGQPDGYDDGTIAPTAALASIAFAPEICIPAAEALHRLHGAQIFGQYGFKDAFNPSFRDVTKKPETGAVDPVHGWVASDYLGIDQGPILAMIANYRSESVWRVMRNLPHIRRGLRRAGFTGSWLDR